MAASFIPALVIKHNNDVYLSDDLVIGVTQDIPTPGAGGTIDGDFWAVPITDNVVSGFNFIPTTPTSTDKPTNDSFHVFRLYSRNRNDVWWVRGTTTFDGESPANPGYIQVSQDAECCDVTPRTLPTDVPTLAACQVMCNFDADGKYFATVGLPTLTGNLRYFPYGTLNGDDLAAASTTGYASVAALLAFLNSGSWGAIGTWTQPDDKNGDPSQTLVVTQTAGPGTDVLCMEIITVNPSA